MRAKLTTESAEFHIDFNDSVTAREIVARLPVESVVSTWGDEIYFNLGFKASAENAGMDVKVLDVAYWPQGKCLCIFFGPTPASSTQEPVPASPVVVVGRTLATPKDLRAVQLGERLKLEVC